MSDIENEDLQNEDETNTDELETEIESEEEIEVEEENPISSLINSVDAGKFADATDIFNDEINNRIRDALDAKRVSLAQSVFNNANTEEPETEDEE